MVFMKLASPSQFKAAQPIIRRNWPKILNWIRYFCFEATDAGVPSNELDVSRTIAVLTQVIATVSRDNLALFTEALGSDGIFFETLLRIWWKSDKRADTAPSIPCMAFAQVCTSINYMVSQRKLGASPGNIALSNISDITNTVLRAVDGDAPALAKRVIGYFTNPVHREKGAYEFAFRALSLIEMLVTDEKNSLSKFTTTFFQQQLGLHALHHLNFILLDANCGNPTLSETVRPLAAFACFGIMTRTLMVPGALHWATVLLKNGFLHCIANILGPPYFSRTSHRKLLNLVFLHMIPHLLVHREFVLSVIEAMKEAVRDGSAKHFESSFFKDEWKIFTQMVLERTIFNAIYERSCVAHFFEQRRCSNVSNSHCIIVPF